jgi:hypothetical protein
VPLASLPGFLTASMSLCGGIGPETSATLDKIQKVLKAAGFELKDVVCVTV